MSKSLSSRLSRRRFLLSVGYMPIIPAGYFAGNRIPSKQSATTRARKRIIPARYLGLSPNPDKDQSRAFERALALAARRDAWIRLDAGVYVIGNLEIFDPVRLMAHGKTRLQCRPRSDFLMSIQGEVVELSKIVLEGHGEGNGQDPLVYVRDCNALNIAECSFQNFDGTGLSIENCQGAVRQSQFKQLSAAALHSQDGERLLIEKNSIKGCGDNGILVWQSKKRADGSTIRNNTIVDIQNRSGGDGPYGNGINVYRAGDVTIEGNTIRKCAYSAIRNNSGDDCKILDNECEELGEVAIFVEFEWRKALVRGNRVRNASAGISATNMDHGARDAIIEKNVIENMRPRVKSVDVLGYGISAEVETVIRDNVVRKTSDCGITLGWGPYLKDVTATKNRIEDCTYGIGVSVTSGVGRATITYNTIVRAKRGNIVGFDHDRPVTGDFLQGAQPPSHVRLQGNVAKT